MRLHWAWVGRNASPVGRVQLRCIGTCLLPGEQRGMTALRVAPSRKANPRPHRQDPVQPVPSPARHRPLHPRRDRRAVRSSQSRDKSEATTIHPRSCRPGRNAAECLFAKRRRTEFGDARRAMRPSDDIAACGRRNPCRNNQDAGGFGAPAIFVAHFIADAPSIGATGRPCDRRCLQQLAGWA